jgi:hypothetical protein
LATGHLGGIGHGGSAGINKGLSLCPKCTQLSACNRAGVLEQGYLELIDSGRKSPSIQRILRVRTRSREAESPLMTVFRRPYLSGYFWIYVERFRHYCHTRAFTKLQSEPVGASPRRSSAATRRSCLRHSLIRGPCSTPALGPWSH